MLKEKSLLPRPNIRPAFVLFLFQWNNDILIFKLCIV